MLVTDLNRLSPKSKYCRHYYRSLEMTLNILDQLSLYDRIRSIAICDNGCWIPFRSFWLLSILVTINKSLFEILKILFWLFEAAKFVRVVSLNNAYLFARTAMKTSSYLQKLSQILTIWLWMKLKKAWFMVNLMLSDASFFVFKRQEDVFAILGYWIKS